MYQKVQKLGGRTTNTVRIIGIEDNQYKIVTYHGIRYENY
jgi:hypothetical protein